MLLSILSLLVTACTVAAMDGCNLCRDDAIMAYPARIVPATSGLTCSQLQDRATFQKECEAYRHAMSKAIDVLAFCGCTQSTAQNTCSICKDDNALSISAPLSECKIVATVASKFIVEPRICSDLKHFAGDKCCEDVAPPTDVIETPCNLCGNEHTTLIDPRFEIPSHKGYTCAEALDLASFFRGDGDVCETSFLPLSPGCCKSQGRCSICSDPKATLRFPHRQLPLAMGVDKKASTCIEVEFSLGYFSNDQCDFFHETTAPIDVQSWCGCEDAAYEAIPEPCSLCGSEWDIVHNFQIPDAPIGVTCASLKELAPYVAKSSFCDSHIEILRDECCGKLPSNIVPNKQEFSTSIAEMDWPVISDDHSAAQKSIGSLIFQSTNVMILMTLLLSVPL